MSMSAHPYSVQAAHNNNVSVPFTNQAGKGINPTKPYSSGAGFSVFAQTQGYGVGASSCVLAP